jgi:hypothetical protein
VLEAKKERLARDGFSTGIDMFEQEEVARRAARAARFNITEPKVPRPFWVLRPLSLLAAGSSAVVIDICVL